MNTENIGIRNKLHLFITVLGVALMSACSNSNDNDDLTQTGSTGSTSQSTSCPTLAELIEVPCPGVMTADTIMDGGVMTCPDGLDIDGATLEMMGGSQLRLGGGTSEVINGGSIMSIGTEDCPNRITSSQVSPGAGDWKELWIHPGNPNTLNQFTHTIIEYGGHTLPTSILSVTTTGESGKLVFENVTVRHMTNGGLDLRSADVEGFQQVSFSNLGGRGIPVELLANDVAAIDGPIDIDSDTVGSPALDIKGSTLDTTSLWEDVGAPYRIADEGGMTITGATLTITDGVSLWFAPGSTGLDVGTDGTLKMAGTAARPIDIRSSAATPLPGDWGEIFVSGNATEDSFFNYVNVQHGGKNSQGAFDLYESVGMTNSTFQNNQRCDVNLHGSAVVNPDTNNSYANCF